MGSQRLEVLQDPLVVVLLFRDVVHEVAQESLSHFIARLHRAQPLDRSLHEGRGMRTEAKGRVSACPSEARGLIRSGGTPLRLRILAEPLS